MTTEQRAYVEGLPTYQRYDAMAQVRFAARLLKRDGERVICGKERSMSEQPDSPLNLGRIEDPVSGCKSSEGSTAREDALRPAASLTKETSCDLCERYGPPDADGRHPSPYTAHGWYRCKLRTPQGEPALTSNAPLRATREPVVTAPQGNAGESPASTSSNQRPTLLQMTETALGQWLHDFGSTNELSFGSTNELSHRSRIILDLIRQDETATVQAAHREGREPLSRIVGDLEWCLAHVQVGRVQLEEITPEEPFETTGRQNARRINDNAAREIERLQEALLKYGHHLHPNCHDLTLNADGSFGERNGCLCGFDTFEDEDSPKEPFGPRATLQAAVDWWSAVTPASSESPSPQWVRDAYGILKRSSLESTPLRPGDVLGTVRMVYTGKLPPRKFAVDAEQKPDDWCTPEKASGRAIPRCPHCMSNTIKDGALVHDPDCEGQKS
jgi:hypothetical protein